MASIFPGEIHLAAQDGQHLAFLGRGALLFQEETEDKVQISLGKVLNVH